jgi:hypothetical protein
MAVLLCVVVAHYSPGITVNHYIANIDSIDTHIKANDVNASGLILHCFGLLYVSKSGGRDGKLTVQGNLSISIHSKRKWIQI